jgi:PfaD family protein
MTVLEYSRPKTIIGSWKGDQESLSPESDQVLSRLKDLGNDVYLIDHQGMIIPTNSGLMTRGEGHEDGYPVVGVLPAVDPTYFGDPGFLSTYGLKYPYMAGAMANAISGIDLVLALGREGFLASYGAGGVPIPKIEEAIHTIQEELPDGPYAFNLIHNPHEPTLEQKTAELFLKNQIRHLEASAFLRLTPAVVQYRVAGLAVDEDGNPIIQNRVIAKLSRPEVAIQFLNPAPEKILNQLVSEGKITPEQAKLAEKVPMADDITVEADSGGHTDNRPLVGLLPSIIALRNQTQKANQYNVPVRVGAGGGISTPSSVLGAFAMGAAYVVTGSINQACLEAGTSTRVKEALAKAAAPDVMMAPSADMFEMGVKVQVLKRGTMFPMRAQKLYDTYMSHSGLDELSPELKAELEGKIFQDTLENIWVECVKFFNERDPGQLEKAKQDPKRKMALVFRWYLGLATYWGIQGLPERVLDYQIWCGPAMGAFNDWAQGTNLEKAAERNATLIARELLQGAAYQLRINQIIMQGINLPMGWERYSAS